MKNWFSEGFTEEEINEACISYDITNRKLELEEMEQVINGLRAKKAMLSTDFSRKEPTSRETFMYAIYLQSPPSERKNRTELFLAKLLS